MPLQQNIFAVMDKLREIYPQRQFVMSRFEEVFDHIEDFTKLLHHRKEVLLQRHLVVSVGQQNLFGDGGVFQDLEITVEPFS